MQWQVILVNCQPWGNEIKIGGVQVKLERSLDRIGSDVLVLMLRGKIMLSESEREAMYIEPKEVIAETIVWEPKANGKRFYLKVPIRRQNGEELTLRAYYSQQRYSFALLYRGSILIRRWDFEYHQNPGKSEVFKGVPHKHKWAEDYGDEFVYQVYDVPMNDVEQALTAFLEECNISVIGTIQPSMFDLS
jgi:hypothetical protein